MGRKSKVESRSIVSRERKVNKHKGFESKRKKRGVIKKGVKTIAKKGEQIMKASKDAEEEKERHRKREEEERRRSREGYLDREGERFTTKKFQKESLSLSVADFSTWDLEAWV